MKKITMKGKNVDDAVDAALKVLGGEKDNATIKVLGEGKSGLLGIGSEESEVEVLLKEGKAKDTQDILQELLDKMTFVTMVEGREDENGRVNLDIKGEDMGRIIGKEGATLKSLEILTSSMASRVYGERVLLSIDADGYKDKRAKSLQRLAQDAADEVVEKGFERPLPPMSPADRRIIHMYLADNPKITTYSKGEGKERRLVIAPK